MKAVSTIINIKNGNELISGVIEQIVSAKLETPPNKSDNNDVGVSLIMTNVVGDQIHLQGNYSTFTTQPDSSADFNKDYDQHNKLDIESDIVYHPNTLRMIYNNIIDALSNNAKDTIPVIIIIINIQFGNSIYSIYNERK